MVWQVGLPLSCSQATQKVFGTRFIYNIYNLIIIIILLLQHEAMRSLSEVMEYFIQTSGGREHTRPMETNDLTLLGLRNPDYDTHIPIGKWFLQVFYVNET